MPSCAIEGCAGPVASRGWCEAHYRRWLRHGDPCAGRALKGEARRFLDSALAYDGADCLIWPFQRDRDGYALISHDGRPQRVQRIICRERCGEPPTPGHEVAHSCGRGRNGCVTPGHLRWATSKENSADAALHGTQVRGQRQGNAKLTDQQARDILALRGKRNLREIAAEFDVSIPTVSAIHTGRNWAWLERTP